jgi:AcrR family transcriptional regulator
MMEAAPSARARKADDTRRRIFTAAATLIAERGYHAVTVAEIARRAKVAKGTFFVHFATKDAIVTELVRIQTKAARRARADVLAGGGTPIDALRATTLALGEQAGASLELSRAVLAAALESAAVGGATSALFDEVFAEMQTDSIEVFGDDRAARALMACYLGAALHVCSSPSARPMREVLPPLVEIQLAAFPSLEDLREQARFLRAARSRVRKPARRRRPRRR